MGVEVGEWQYEPLLRPLHASLQLAGLAAGRPVRVAIKANQEAPTEATSAVSFTPTVHSPP